MPLSPGQLVGRYRVDALVGRGGMGEVYRGWDPQLARQVALKTMREDFAANAGETASEVAARFAREARMAGAFVSPMFATLYDVVEHEGRPMLVMEWVEGVSLRQHIGDPAGSLDERLTWIAAMARGLADAHDAGIVHRDIKPGNVLVTRNGAIKIVDFGLAKRSPRANALAETSGFQTRTGSVLGTEKYMAPEQAAGAPCDERTDQFAWGVVAYELLSGTHPRNTAPAGSFPHAPPRPLTELAVAIPPSVSAVVARALSLVPEARYASMRDVIGALEKRGSSRAPAAASAPNARRNSRVFAVSAGVTFLVAAALVATGLVLRVSKRNEGKSSPSPPVTQVTSSNLAPTSIEESAPSAAPSLVPSASETHAAPAPKVKSTAVAHGTASVAPTPTGSEPAPPPRRSDQPRSIRFIPTVFMPHGYSIEDLKAAVDPAWPAIKACYATPQFDDDVRQVAVYLERIDDGGKPSKIVVGASGTLSKRLRTCLEQAVAPIKLPPRTRQDPSTTSRFLIDSD